MWFISLETGETSDLTDRQLIDCVWSTDVSRGSLDRWYTRPRELFLNGAINIFNGTIDIFVKTPRIIFKVLNFECIISKSIVFTSFFYSHHSERNEILRFAKKKLFFWFSHWKNRGPPYIRAYTVNLSNNWKNIQVNLCYVCSFFALI
jgi:hypothetical protein